MQKRGFNIQEAQAYLGVKRKFFDTNLAPLLADKGTRTRTAMIFERTDLDAAWETYKEANKLLAGNERPPSFTRSKTMGRSNKVGVQASPDGTFDVDAQYRKRRIRKRGFVSQQEAEDFLIQQKEAIRVASTAGLRPKVTLAKGAARYLLEKADTPSAEPASYALVKMALFDLNTGVRKNVLANLRRHWEIQLEIVSDGSTNA